MNEDDFLEALFKRMPVPPGELVIPPGDDCAGFRMDDGSLLLIAVDQVIEGRHFLEEGLAAVLPQFRGPRQPPRHGVAEPLL